MLIGSVMTYGDEAELILIFLHQLMLPHEIGHAICSNTANLAYQPESGAMNEAFSDIWEPVLNIMQRQINLPG
jgi:Zn-dependent metalloprotease